MPRGILEKDVGVPWTVLGKPWVTGCAKHCCSLGRFYWAIQCIHSFPKNSLGQRSHLSHQCEESPQDTAPAEDSLAVVVYFSPMRMEGPEHLSPPLVPSCASWLFGGWFWKGHPPLICGESCQGGCHQAQGGCKCFSASQLAGPVSPPKPGGGADFWRHCCLLHPCPYWGDISV